MSVQNPEAVLAFETIYLVFCILPTSSEFETFVQNIYV